MNNWWNYIQHRMYVAGQMIIATGISLSAWNLASTPSGLPGFFLSFVGLVLIFSYLRLKDDFDDLNEDRIAHKQRPLVQKVLSVPQVRAALSSIWAVMLVFTLVLGVLLNLTAAFIYLLVLGYIWLWNKHFYAEIWFKRYPLAEDVIKQELTLLLVFFSVSCQSSHQVFNPETLSYALLVFGAFFTYDICRKLDPFAHPIIKGYIQLYGFKLAFTLAAAALFISSLGAFGLGVEWILLPFQIAVIISLSFLFIQPRQFKLAERLSVVSLFLHLYAGVYILP